MDGTKGQAIEYQFIARPDSAKELLFYKWPDTKIKFLSVVTVQPDEQALFVDKGELAGYLPQGQHRLDGPGIPLLQGKIDEFTGGKVLLGELYFVSTREFANRSFGGSMGQINDPDSEMMVGMQVLGDYAFRATDPGKLLLQLLGTRRPLDNIEVQTLISGHLLFVLRSLVNLQITENEWPVLKVTSGAHNLAIEQKLVPAVNERLADYGLEVTRIQDFNLSIDRADAVQLKELYQRKARTKLAEGDAYQRMAEAEAMLGAAEGLKNSGGTGGGMGNVADFAGIGIGLGVGMKVADKMTGGKLLGDGAPAPQLATPAPAPATQPASDALVSCPACGASVHAGAFCSACGAPLSPPAGSAPEAG